MRGEGETESAGGSSWAGPPETSSPTRLSRCSKGLLLGALILAAALRLTTIDRLPPFFDELGNVAVGIDPGARAAIDPVGQARPFLSYQYRFLELLPGNFLVAARVSNALLGVLCVLLCFLIIRKTAGVRPALLGASIWAITPFFVVHDRMALQDPVVTFFLWGCLASFVLHPRFPGIINEPLSRGWMAWLLGGVFFGFASATKISALIQAPAVVTLLWFFAVRLGEGFRWTPGLFGRAIFGALVAAGVVFLCAGTFHDYGGRLLQLGHLQGGLAAPAEFPFFAHVQHQWFVLARYIGSWAIVIFLILFLIGLLIRQVRVIALLSAALVVIDTQVYRGVWFPRYFLPDHIVYMILFVFVMDELTRPYRRQGTVFFCYFLLSLLLWAPRLERTIFEPLREDSPAYNYYGGGYNSGVGLTALRSKVDEQLEGEKPLVVFTCQYWCLGMYDLLLHSYENRRLYLVPLLLNQEGRVFTIWKVMEKFRKELSGDVSFNILYEPPKYNQLLNLPAFGVKVKNLLDLFRASANGSEAESRFVLDLIEMPDRDTLLDRFPPQISPWNDLWVGPKSEFRLVGPMPASFRFIFPPELSPETEVEIRVNDQPVIKGAIQDLPKPLSLSAGAVAPETRILKIEVRCSDWVVPSLLNGRRDTRALCFRFSEALPLENLVQE